ncbi:MarR family winged helix-turn-helix transcriptional regulator [Clostridium manihotivorum]|uniref:MarR family winged helix-turn-helix transcriptional regulator n=1 Tax=Clostridium manihotivorum TaxID=2320868 RepID=UPI0030840E39
MKIRNLDSILINCKSSDIIRVKINLEVRVVILLDITKELFLMQQAYATLFSLTNKIQIVGDKRLEGLTSRQFMAIVALAHLEEDERTINNIARKLGTTKQSVKQLLDIMEKKGYIETVPSTKDKRAVNVKVTEEGGKVIIKCSELGVYLLTDLFKDFSSSEIETLWTLLKKLYSFDGQMQDGFEELGTLDLGADLDGFNERVITEFERQRNLKKEL